MHIIDTVVIGAGHAGLAVSRLLAREGRDHVVLERGRVAESWLSARWDSLHLLTPTWMTRLPDWSEPVGDPDGFMSAGALAQHLEAYAASFGSPVARGTAVEEVAHRGGRYVVCTDRGSWAASHVVIATGPGSRPHLPPALEPLAGELHVVAACDYRNPDLLPAGGVLVVGASASGVQIADELRRAGREVVLSVGRHTRLPRSYRGLDVYRWIERTGRSSRTIEQVRDPRAARREPSAQLVGRGPGDAGATEVDLPALRARGVRLVGRLSDSDGRRVCFADDLETTTTDADRRMNRFLDSVDRQVDAGLLGRRGRPAERPRPLGQVRTATALHVRAERIRTVVVAAGYRQDLPWLRLSITTPEGDIRHRRGVTPAPGVYVVGQRFQHRRDSAMIDGARHDAAMVVAHLVGSSGRGPGWFRADGPDPRGGDRRELA
ncbi:pyridine nucleotide-disulfide oxidoreductase [Intrasporangium oryzae NRRL B-24470]|uniref:Pyridine nucleotide-disulfide oxidoreductase n=1 Tax=Intrasporangium oryzae NRRL B-24470 TaxID=1386089 RepID=W9G6J0_9MICO|nr:NAD(P)/FAD-dependent oxidoreductase [Intrasporangium oryzae]EWT01615.1 pyridine nucleotide-disulfide oxidoreductase [Intrasporangium oryzae NRRL B-24470]